MKKKKVYKDIEEIVKDEYNEVGRCFKCGTDDLNYEDSEQGSGYMIYPYTCNKCKHEGEEHYNIDWVEQT